MQQTSNKLYQLNNFMKSSLPEIYRKDLKLLSIPQKQSSQFSLYLRNNTFKPNQTASGQNRYNKSSARRINKSMDYALSASKDLILTEDMKGKDSLKRLLSQRKTTRSRSMFIEEKSNDHIEQVDSFKTIRKRVLQQLTLLEKSMPIVSNMQNTIKCGMEEFKQRQIESLQRFELQILKKMALLQSTFKGLKRQTKTQVKVNRDQLNFIQQEFATYRQLVQGFQEKENKFKYELVEGGSTATSNHR